MLILEIGAFNAYFRDWGFLNPFLLDILFLLYKEFCTVFLSNQLIIGFILFKIVLFNYFYCNLTIVS